MNKKICNKLSSEVLSYTCIVPLKKIIKWLVIVKQHTSIKKNNIWGSPSSVIISKILSQFCAPCEGSFEPGKLQNE